MKGQMVVGNDGPCNAGIQRPAGDSRLIYIAKGPPPVYWIAISISIILFFCSILLWTILFNNGGISYLLYCGEAHFLEDVLHQINGNRKVIDMKFNSVKEQLFGTLQKPALCRILPLLGIIQVCFRTIQEHKVMVEACLSK